MSYSYTLWAAKTGLTDEEILLRAPRFERLRPRTTPSEWVVLHYGYGLEGNCFDADSSLTPALSSMLGEVLFVHVDSTVECFAYEHSRGGTLLRKLNWHVLHDQLGSWEVVKGEREGWEERLLFGERGLGREITRLAQERGPGTPQFRSDEIVLREIWSKGRIVTGAKYPAGDASLGAALLADWGISIPEQKNFERPIRREQRVEKSRPPAESAKGEDIELPEALLSKLDAALPLDLEDLYSVFHDRGPVAALDERKVAAVASRVTCSALREVFLGESTPSQRHAALTLYPRTGAGEGARPNEIDHVLLGWLNRSESYRPCSSEASCFEVLDLGRAAHLALFECVRREGAPRRVALAREVFSRLLGSSPVVRGVASNFGSLWSSLEPEEVLDLGEFFLESVTDTGRSTEFRSAALRTVVEADSHYRLPGSDKWEGAKSQILSKYRERLEAIASDGAAPPALMDPAKVLLGKLSPPPEQPRPEFAGVGCELPPASSLTSGYETPAKDKLDEIAKSMQTAAVVELLQNSGAVETEMLYTALFLTPVLAKRDGRREISHALLPLTACHRVRSDLEDALPYPQRYVCVQAALSLFSILNETSLRKGPPEERAEVSRLLSTVFENSLLWPAPSHVDYGATVVRVFTLLNFHGVPIDAALRARLVEVLQDTAKVPPLRFGLASYSFDTARRGRDRELQATARAVLQSLRGDPELRRRDGATPPYHSDMIIDDALSWPEE